MRVSTAPLAILEHMNPAENNPETTRLGGITGNGFKPGQSGNPGGRPKGLAKTVRDLCGGSPRVLPGSCWRSPRIRKPITVIEWPRVGSCLTVGGARLLPSRLWRPGIRSRCRTLHARFKGSRTSLQRGERRSRRRGNRLRVEVGHVREACSGGWRCARQGPRATPDAHESKRARRVPDVTNLSAVNAGERAAHRPRPTARTGGHNWF